MRVARAAGPSGIRAWRVGEERGEVRRLDRTPDDAPAGPPAHHPTVDAGRGELREDHLSMLDQLGNAARLEDGYDVVLGEESAGRRAPDVDAAAVGDQEPGVDASQRAPNALNREPEIAREHHGRLRPRRSHLLEPGAGGKRQHPQQGLDHAHHQLGHSPPRCARCGGGHGATTAGLVATKVPKLPSAVVWIETTSRPAAPRRSGRSRTARVLCWVTR